MGFKRVLGSGILGMLCLLPMAWVSFYFLDLPSQITGGLIKNIAGIGEALPQGGNLIVFVIGAFLGLALICLFPIHWCLIYYPNDIMLLVAVILPWILCCSITAGLTAHTPRGGLHTSLAIGIGYMLLFLIGYGALGAAVSQVGGAALIDGLLTGLTDMPFALAVITATMEGALVGGVFGAFVGSLKYNPGGKGSSKSSSKSFVPKAEPTLDSFDIGKSSSESAFCTNCGAKYTPGVDEFCTNCGAKIK